jgi:predicted Rossmann fold flavoprotein
MIERYDVAVIGGGAAGMMAAGRAAELGARVVLLEKNRELGLKLNLTGGGRCNITNAEFDRHRFLANFEDAKDYLFSPYSQFGVEDTFSFFEKLDLPLVVEARARAFPRTQKAEDVTKSLSRYLKKGSVRVVTESPALKFTEKDGKIAAVLSKGGTYEAKNFILATGGLSHPETGSTGDGFRFLARLGHRVRKPSPDVVPLAVKEKWVKDLSGVSLSFMKITFFQNGKKAFSKTGKILFTHFGLSGPLILNSARKVKELLSSGAVTALIDAYPHTDLGALEKQVVSAFDRNKNRLLKNMIDDIVPEGTGKAILSLLPALSEVKVHSITKEQRNHIVRLLKALPLTISGLMGFDRAVVSDGGVSLDQIDMKTMRSLLCPNLFIVGDLLDINRPSGGFSLQLCWTFGYVAGTNAARM